MGVPLYAPSRVEALGGGWSECPGSEGRTLRDPWWDEVELRLRAQVSSLLEAHVPFLTLPTKCRDRDRLLWEQRSQRWGEPGHVRAAQRQPHTTCHRHAGETLPHPTAPHVMGGSPTMPATHHVTSVPHCTSAVPHSVLFYLCCPHVPIVPPSPRGTPLIASHCLRTIDIQCGPQHPMAVMTPHKHAHGARRPS